MSDRRLSAARLFAWGSPEAIPFARRGLLLVLSAEDSEAVGLGEAAPLAGFSLETLEDGERALRRVPWADVVVPRELDELFAVTAAAAGGARERAARFALETALGSLAAWGRGVSLATFLARREIASAVPRSVLVGRVGEETALERTDRAARAGARSLKLKHSRPDHEATAAFLERVRAVAEAHLGARPALRVDYNGALDVRDVAPALTTLARAGVELVEEPCRGAALLELGPFDVPWLADESLVDESLRARLLAHPHVGGFVLKPTLLGGLAVSLRIADVARDRGLPVVVTHAFAARWGSRLRGAGPRPRRPRRAGRARASTTPFRGRSRSPTSRRCGRRWARPTERRAGFFLHDRTSAACPRTCSSGCWKTRRSAFFTFDDRSLLFQRRLARRCDAT